MKMNYFFIAENATEPQAVPNTDSGHCLSIRSKPVPEEGHVVKRHTSELKKSHGTTFLDTTLGIHDGLASDMAFLVDESRVTEVVSTKRKNDLGPPSDQTFIGIGEISEDDNYFSKLPPEVCTIQIWNSFFVHFLT